MTCRRICDLDPAGARADDYGRLLQAIGREFPDAHFHTAGGLRIIYVGDDPDDDPDDPDA